MKWTGGALGVALLVIIAMFSQCGGDNGNLIDTVATPIAKTVDDIKIANKYYNERVQLKTRVYYRANQNERAWLGERGPNKLYDAFVEEVKGSSRYGFQPEDYRIDDLEKAVDTLFENKQRTANDVSSLDIRITASFFLFTTHLLEGRVRYPGAKEFLWVKGTPLENDIALLVKVESESDLKKELASLHPEHPQYRDLQGILEQYTKASEADTLPEIPATINAKDGDRDSALVLVREKLRLLNYEVPRTEDPTAFDAGLAQVISNYQQDHGLEADGNIGKQTIIKLNTPIEAKARIIALNLERYRWHPRVKREGETIVVNVPEYMLRVYRNNDEKMKMRVILGAWLNPTPIFHDTLKYIVLSPTWAVPQSIFKEEFLPKLVEDSEHFDNERFLFYKNGKQINPYEEEWDDKDLDSSAYRVVENPGELNSLGRIKFIMPNNFAIYLHDTPADRLFKLEERALSHGCVRVEKPLQLAEYLVNDLKEWNVEKIRKGMQSEEPIRIDLPKPVPVFIVYHTVWVDEDGQPNFRDDIYGHDQRQLDRLALVSVQPDDKN